MTTDLDRLRAVLRDRADLAPTLDEILPTMRRLIRRRQVRRRVTLVAGVVVVTAFALVGVGLFGLLWPHDRTADQQGGPLQPPVLPFTVGVVPKGYVLNAWNTSHGLSVVQFFGGRSQQVMDFQSTTYDPSHNDHQTRTYMVNGHPAVLGVMPDGQVQQLSWEAAPGLWMGVFGPMDTIADGQLLDSAQSVAIRPTVQPVALRMAGLPAGFAVDGWFGALQGRAVDVTVTLCPTNLPRSNDPYQCIDVHLGTGTAPRIDSLGPLPNSLDNSVRPAGRWNTKPVITVGGRVVTRQVDGTHWVAATSNSADPTEVLRLAESVTVG